MKIAVLFTRLGPYHQARLRAAGRLCELTAIELSAVDTTYAWEMVDGAVGFNRLTLFSEVGFHELPISAMRNALWAALDQNKPDCVAIPGWAEVPALLALQWCHRHKIPTILMSDSQEIDEPRVWWREWIKTRIVKQFSAGLVAGISHIAYLKMLGFYRQQVFPGYDVVDNQHFSSGADCTRTNAMQHRLELGLPVNYFLNSSRFIEKKNLFRLLDAYSQYLEAAGSGAWHLVIIGDGHLRPELEAKIRLAGLTAHVHMPGFKQYDELPSYYALAGAYIQASTTEQWGLVVNEAMASGLPVLVSDRCGCATDLVQEGVNGYTFDPFDVSQLAQMMTVMSADQSGNQSMGQASRKIIENWTPETFAKNLIKAADAAILQPLPKSSILDQAILKGLIHR